MTLTPEQALAYLKELSADYRAGAILDADGTLLAGHEALAITLEPGRHEGAAKRGKVFAHRTPTHAIVVATGPFALAELTHHDLRTALSALGAKTAQETPVQRIPHGSVEALLKASNWPFRPHSAI